MRLKATAFVFAFLSIALGPNSVSLASGSKTIVVTLDRDAYASADIDALSDQIRELVDDSQNPVRISAFANEVVITSDDIERDAVVLATVKQRLKDDLKFSVDEIDTKSIAVSFVPEILKSYSAEKLSREKDRLDSFVKNLRTLPPGVVVTSRSDGVIVHAENPTFGVEAAREIGALFIFEPVDQMSWRVTPKSPFGDHMTPAGSLNEKGIVEFALRTFLGEPHDVSVQWTDRGVAVQIPHWNDKAHVAFADAVRAAFAGKKSFALSEAHGLIMHVVPRAANVSNDSGEIRSAQSSYPNKAVLDVMGDLEELANPAILVDREGAALWVHAKNAARNSDRLATIKQGLADRADLSITTKPDQSLLIALMPGHHLAPSPAKVSADQLNTAVTLRAASLGLRPENISTIDGEHVRIKFLDEKGVTVFCNDLSDSYGFAIRLVSESKLAESSSTSSPSVDTKVLPTGELVRLVPGFVVNGSMIEDAKAEKDKTSGMPVVEFQLTSEGRTRFALATRLNVGKRFAIILDGKVLTAPVVETPIEGGKGEISGNLKLDEAQAMAASILAYREELPLKIVEERSFR